MKKKKLFFISIFIILFSALQSYATLYTINNDTLHFLNDNYYFIGPNDTVLIDTSRVTVSFLEGTPLSSISSFESTYNLTLVEDLCSGNKQYYTPIGQNFISLGNSITNDVNTDNLIIHFYMKLYEFEPNDDEIEDQWYLKNIGVYDHATNEGVWEITKGNNEVIVAVLDSGLEWDLKEFGPVEDNIDVIHNNLEEDDWYLWNRPNTGNDTDDDDNGYTDDFKGWDFYHNNTDSGGNADSDDNDVRANHEDLWHGNALAAIISAKTNNSRGIAGIAGGDAEGGESGVTVLPLKVGDLKWVGGYLIPVVGTADVELAICYATEMGADIINMSFGCYFGPKLNLEDEVEYAHNNGVTLIAAAGNEGIDFHTSYPSIMDYVIAVGSTDQDDEHCSVYSNQGPEMEIAAPGGVKDAVEITLLNNGGGTTTDWGTSYSAAMVSATVGLMLSVNPSLSNGDITEDGSIRNILMRTAQKTGIYPYNDNGIGDWNKKLGYGRLQTYDAVCMAIDYKPEIVVENNDTWSDRVISNNDIIIEEGVNLTITGEVFMGKNTKIIVKPGAVLTIDGGIVSNIPFCGREDEMWSSIEVWGNRQNDQFEFSGHPQAQGKLILNDATIENAVVAVRLFDYFNRSTTTGGVLIANNTIFRNNLRSVSIWPFKNILESIEYDYQARFTNCTFTNDENALSGFSYAHVVMWDVKGIKINGCVFENNLNSTPSGRAIYTNDAGFVIKGACESQDIQPCPTGEYHPTTFNGFYRAIESANSSNALYQIYVRESDFANNGIGIHFSAVNDAVVVGNKIELGKFDDCIYDASIGIYLDNCKRFAIEKNEFGIHQPAATITNVGIHTVNTNNKSDIIYNNSFDDLIVANYAEGKNWDVDEYTGLAYYCNKNLDNVWDFYVEKDNGSGTFGIQIYQGNPLYVAGNTFSTSATGHFQNSGAYEIDYFYDNASTPEIPDINKVFKVNREPLQLSNTCPSHYTGGDIILSPTAYQQREADYLTALSSYNTAYSNYGSASDSASKRLYEEQMSHYNMLLSLAAYDIIRSDLADTVTHPDSFIDWQEELNTYATVESMVDLYLQQGNYTTAMNKVDSLVYNFIFSTYDSLEYPHYSELKSMQSSWLSSGRNIFELTSVEIANLAVIANSSHGLAGAQARGILAFAIDSIGSYSNCIKLPESSTNAAPLGDMEEKSDDLISIGIKPNPATNFVNFDYTLPNSISHSELLLYNPNGKLIDRIELENSKGEIRYNCSHLEAGIYFYTVSCSNSYYSGKFIIIK